MRDGRTGRFAHEDQPGLADCYLVPQLYNGRRFGLDLAAYPTLLADRGGLRRAAGLPGRPPGPASPTRRRPERRTP